VVPPATLKVAVTGTARVFPPALVTPPSPAGTVMVSVVEGTKGAEGTKANVSGVTSRHTPATAGASVGVGEVGLRGSENWTDSVASVGTAAAPAAGVTVATVNGPWLTAASTPWATVEGGDAEARPDGVRSA
jgi:hypothetical protein